MTTMVEKVAKALYPNAFEKGDVFESHAKTKARAAIEAMAEPTDTMIKAGEDNVDGSADVSYIFTAMMQASLMEDSQ